MAGDAVSGGLPGGQPVSHGESPFEGQPSGSGGPPDAVARLHGLQDAVAKVNGLKYPDDLETLFCGFADEARSYLDRGWAWPDNL